MPNWCTNNITVSHVDPSMMAKFKEAFDKGALLETFIPTPPNEDWYFFHVKSWGTKWDVGGDDAEFILNEDGLSGSGWFDSAWAPPIAAYEKMTELGFLIDATYLETGMTLAGHYTSENGDDNYEYDFSDTNWRDEIDDEEVIELLEDEYEFYLELEDADIDYNTGD